MTTPRMPRRLRSVPKKAAALQSIEASLMRLVATLGEAAAAVDGFIGKIEQTNNLPKNPRARLKWARDLAAVARIVRNAQAVLAPPRAPGRGRKRVGMTVVRAKQEPRPAIIPIGQGRRRASRKAQEHRTNVRGTE